MRKLKSEFWLYYVFIYYWLIAFDILKFTIRDFNDLSGVPNFHNEIIIINKASN